MAHTVETRLTTPAAELRDLLDRAERGLPALTSAGLVPYLQDLDRTEALIESLAAEMDLRTEMTRWLDLQARLGARSDRLVKLARPLGGFAALRAANPPATGSWWRLDELLAADRKRNWTRWLVTAAVALGILLAAALIYRQWLAPSPEVVLSVSTVNDIEQLAMEGRWDEAYTLVEQTLQMLPDDPDLLVWAAVISEQRGDSEAAQAYLDRAGAAVGDPLRLQLTLGMRRLQAGNIDGAEAAAQAALAINAEEAQGVFLLANVAEMRGDPQTALDLYQKTADLAEESNPQLTVVAKMRFGMLIQQPSFILGTPEAAGTPASTPSP